MRMIMKPQIVFDFTMFPFIDCCYINIGRCITRPEFRNDIESSKNGLVSLGRPMNDFEDRII